MMLNANEWSVGNEAERPPVGTLVLFPGALGDAVCAEPAIAWLTALGPVTFYARGAAAEVAGLFPGRPRLGTLDGPEIAKLFAPTHSGSAEVEAWLCGFQRVVSFTGYASEEFRGRLDRLGNARVFPFPGAGGVMHAVDEMLDAVSCGRAAPGAAPRLTLRREGGRLAPLAALAEPRSGGTEPTLLLHPGSGGRGKRAPRELFVGVAHAWRTGLGGRVVLLLGPAERQEEAWWAREVGAVRYPADVPDLAALIADGDVYFGNDAGPSHVASALGVPTLVWFQSTAPERFGPRGPAVEYVLANSPHATVKGVHGALARLLP